MGIPGLYSVFALKSVEDESLKVDFTSYCFAAVMLDALLLILDVHCAVKNKRTKFQRLWF